MYNHLTNEELRNIILGKTTFRKCLMCNGTGQIGEEQKEGWISLPECCEYCDGLGLIQNTKE